MLCRSQDTEGGRRVQRLVLLLWWLHGSHHPGASARGGSCQAPRLKAGTDFGHYLPDLDSCPLPRVAAQLPKRSPLYTRGARALPLDPPRSSSRSAVFSCGGDEIGHLFVENIDLFCSCVTGKQNCV